MSTIIWSTPSTPGAPFFAIIDEVIVGYVTTTAFPDGRWKARVLPNGYAEPGPHCYAGNQARARSFVQNWLRHHAPDTSGWRRVGSGSSERSLSPRKPKGADDRS